MEKPHPLVVGNWKMNGNLAALEQLERLAAMVKAAPPKCAVAICPPMTLISAASELLKLEDMRVGAHDCHDEESGAYTGEVRAIMLAEAAQNS